MYWTSSTGALTTNQWSTTSNSSSSNKKFYFNRLYTNTGATADASSYTTTDDSMLEVWRNGELVIKTPVKDWTNSDRSSSQRMCEAGGYRVTTTSGQGFTTSVSYGIILTNMAPV